MEIPYLSDEKIKKIANNKAEDIHRQSIKICDIMELEKLY